MGGGLPPPIFIFAKAPVNRLGSQVFFLTAFLCDNAIAQTVNRRFCCPYPFAKERSPTNQPDQNQTIGKKSLLEQISTYVEAHLAEKITLKMIADQFSVSVSTVTQLFQKKTKTTFHHFVTRMRMEKARELILQGLPLELVGKKIGYHDHSTFYRAFRHTFGISPREYRKSINAEASE